MRIFSDLKEAAVLTVGLLVFVLLVALITLIAGVKI